MPSEKEKNSIIKPHVQGEYDALKACYIKLKAGLGEPCKRIHSDCFLLHARNLIDFLCNKKRYKTYCDECDKEISERETKDDVLMIDFINNTEPLKRDALLPEYGKFKDVYKRINKQLSHITYSRLNKQEQIDFFDKDEYHETIYENIKKYLTKYNNKVNNKHFEIEI